MGHFTELKVTPRSSSYNGFKSSWTDKAKIIAFHISDFCNLVAPYYPKVIIFGVGKLLVFKQKQFWNTFLIAFPSFFSHIQDVVSMFKISQEKKNCVQAPVVPLTVFFFFKQVTKSSDNWIYFSLFYMYIIIFIIHIFNLIFLIILRSLLLGTNPTLKIRSSLKWF